ncbi:MAG: YgjV family protein [Acholeplasmatales bacterium]|nr:YgjV family protein [Acholeplasmatales bacterium]
MDINDFIGEVDFSNPVILIAYIISTLGFILFTLASALKRKETILTFQSIGNLLCGISEIMTNAWAGLVQDAVNLIRNIFVLSKKMNKVLSVVFILLAFGAGMLVIILDLNSDNEVTKAHAWYGLLPMFATVEYSIIVLIPDVSVSLIKASLMVSSTCWAIYGLIVRLYTITVFNVITFILAVTTLIIYLVKKKRSNKQVEDVCLNEEKESN